MSSSGVTAGLIDVVVAPPSSCAGGTWACEWACVMSEAELGSNDLTVTPSASGSAISPWLGLEGSGRVISGSPV